MKSNLDNGKLNNYQRHANKANEKYGIHISTDAIKIYIYIEKKNITKNILPYVTPSDQLQF